MREFSKNVLPVVALASALRTASATGGTVDRLGNEAVAFLVTAGAWTDGTHTVVLQESTDGTTFTTIDPSNLTDAVPVVNAAGAANKATMVGYIGDARYVRAQSNVTGSPTTGAVVGVTALLSRSRNRPAGSRIV